MSEKNIKKNRNEDVLSKSTSLLTKPFKNTKRKILIAFNLTFVFAIALHITLQLIQFGKLPDPVRDMIFFPLIFFINLFSAGYNLRVIVKQLKGNKFLNGFTPWSSIVLIMLLAISIVHSSPNTATSFLFDFAFSIILIFIVGTVLNRKVAIVWVAITCLSLFLGYSNLGSDYKYYVMTSEQVKTLEEQFEQEAPEAVEWLNTALAEKKAPVPIGVFVIIWIIFIILAFIPTFFESGVIGNLLKVIPTVVKNIEIASEEKNTLENENLRMGMELDVAKHIQTMVLPDISEINNCRDLEVAARMDTAVEVGGDFYEVLPQEDGSTIFGIGDVTNHGLLSGVVMLMTQTAFRTSIDGEDISLSKALKQVNKVIFNNVQTRLKDFRNLTLSFLKYKEGKVTITGQHETVLLLKKDSNKIEEIDTLDLGIYIGLMPNIDEHVSEKTFNLNKGDLMILYTDGVTEAENPSGEFYGIERFKKSIEKHRTKSCKDITDALTEDLYKFIDKAELFDDITLVTIKRT